MHPTSLPKEDRGALGGATRRVRRDRITRSSVATHRALYAQAGEKRCDVCDAVVDSEEDHEGGSGLYVWTRGEEVRYEEPPLCSRCGPAIALTAMRRWEEEDEEEG